MESVQLSNKEVSVLFKTLSGLMELHNENPFKTKSYANAAFNIGRVSKPVMKMNAQELEALPGIGKSVASKILELQQTNSIQVLEQLLDKTPEGVLEMMRIKGIGGKKAAVIWNELGIETVGELLYACFENRLIKLKGFGEKTQDAIIKTIEYYQNNIGKFHFATLDNLSTEIIEEISVKTKLRCELVGDIRRKCNTLEKIELLLALDSDKIKNLPSLIKTLTDWELTENIWRAKTDTNIPVIIHCVSESKFPLAKFENTGSHAHVIAVKDKLDTWPPSINSEQEIYEKAGFPFIPAEMRDIDLNEIDLSNFSTENLIEVADIKGVIHNHSTWSDGKHSLEEMANACVAGGYEYLVISDHSKTAVYAGGLTIDQVIAQHEQIDALNNKLSPFKIFKSIESDILNDGSLDYPDEILKKFDLIIASVHQNLRMDIEKATTRLLLAIENPYTTILGHTTGRLLLSRPGYPVDHKKIIDASAAHQVVIEINANPYRLDIDYTWIPYAMRQGVKISINPDAHSTEGIGDIYYGVCSARKGGLTKSMTLNTLSLREFSAFVENRKQIKGIS
ncbi:MAG TPA: helix-hairpin-helix domain-containing protein [Chitinophagales bacterium]|nr:helix-hairpin-helix domain-containing protein [Chitinophagales bacterium]